MTAKIVEQNTLFNKMARILPKNEKEEEEEERWDELKFEEPIPTLFAIPPPNHQNFDRIKEKKRKKRNVCLEDYKK